MTYAAREISTAQGRPFEVYRFEGPMGVFRFTSLPYSVTVAGETYEPATITRSSIVIQSVVDSVQTMDFNLPADSALCKAYMGRYTPDFLEVVVRRAHEGDDLSTQFTIEWQGAANSYVVEGNWFVINTASIIQSKLLGSTSTVYYQYACNNIVYDSICKANKAAHTVSAIVKKRDNVDITVDAMTYPNGQLALGTMVLDRTGEERSIVANVNNKITVSYPFLEIRVGDTVKLIQGCDNKMATCLARFNNVVNFTGFRFIPTDNPMGGGI